MICSMRERSSRVSGSMIWNFSSMPRVKRRPCFVAEPARRLDPLPGDLWEAALTVEGFLRPDSMDYVDGMRTHPRRIPEGRHSRGRPSCCGRLHKFAPAQRAGAGRVLLRLAHGKPRRSVDHPREILLANGGAVGVGRRVAEIDGHGNA